MSKYNITTFTEQIEKAYTILNQQMIMINSIKSLMTDYNTLSDSTIVSINNNIKTIEENISNIESSIGALEDIVDNNTTRIANIEKVVDNSYSITLTNEDTNNPYISMVDNNTKYEIHATDTDGLYLYKNDNDIIHLYDNDLNIGSVNNQVDINTYGTCT